MSASTSQRKGSQRAAHHKPPHSAKRNLILVLGMHRSGTSALTGALAKLGVELGDKLLPPTADNPKGYFENIHVMLAQEQLFLGMGHPWHDPRALPDGWATSSDARSTRAALVGVVDELFTNAAVVAVKDPRSCRVVPLWLEVAARVHARPVAVLMLRHPNEVAASLQRRDEMSRSRAHLLWLRYLLDAERATRGTPRAFVSYAALLDDWRGEIARIDSALGLTLATTADAAEIDQFLDVSLRNQKATRVDGEESPFESSAMALYALGLRCAADPGQVAAREFDAIASEVDRLAAYYVDAVEDCIAIDLPLQLEDELKRQGLDKSRIDMALHLAALRELWRPAVIARETGACKLYYRVHADGFIEDRALTAKPVAVVDGLQAVFELPAGSRVDHLRIDPDDAPGVFALQSLSIGGVAIADLADRVTKINELDLPSATTQAAVRFAALGDDPHVQLDMRGCAQFAGSDGPLLVELRYRPETVASELGAQMHDVGLGLRDAYEAVCEQQRSLQAGVNRLAKAADEARDAQRTEIDQLCTDLAGLRENQGSNAELLARLGADLAGLRENHGSTAELLAQLGAEAAERDNALAATLAAMHEHQVTLLHWAQRRSLRYWWRRLLDRRDRGHPRTVSTILRLAPLANVHRNGAESDVCAWTSENDDPQFLLGGPELALAGGWYLFDAHFTQVEGQIMSPCLYPDYGSGVSELDRIVLPGPDDDGRIRVVIRLKYPVARLRFDPSMKPAGFCLPAVELRPLGRFGALLRMGAGAAGPDRTGRRMSDVLVPFLRHAIAGRIREAGDLVYGRYFEAQRPPPNDYAAWVRSYDTPSPADLEQMRESAANLANRPLVSIVMPVYQTPEHWLRRCLDSVLAQAYPHWELCIADDASPSPHVRRVLQEYMRKDERIRVVFRQANGHIAAASNSALELATGEYITLLDHDDELPPHALLEVAKAIQAHPEWKLIYSDEDKIDKNGRRFDPYFKPDWNYELFLSQNCVCHLGVYDAGLIAQIGGFRVGLEGSQDWDVALRCIEHLRPQEIGHIPKVLYHWRAIAGSTALGVGQKDYARSAGWRAVTDHLQRTGVEARVEAVDGGYMNVRRQLPAPAPKVSLVIPTRDKAELLRTCVQSILEKTEYPEYEILIVDNQSEERATLDYFAELADQPRVRVLRYDAPFNYSAINNFAAAAATGSIIGLVNNDIEVISPDWMHEMASQAVRPEIGAVGAMLLYPDETIQHAGVILGIGGIAGHPYTGLPAETEGTCGRARLAQEMSAVTAACLFVRKAVFDEVGGLDEKLSVAFNDIDFCLRVRAAGYRNLWTPYAKLYHHESASRGYEDTPEKLARFSREVDFMSSRWGSALLRDPAYNPNLSLETCHFDLAFPPR